MSESGFRDDFKRNFLTGIAALFPVLVTLFLLAWLYRQVDATIGSGTNALCRQLLARHPGFFHLMFPGAAQETVATFQARHHYAAEHFPRVVGVVIGLLATAVIVYLLGKFLRGYIGARLMRGVDRLFTRFPLIKAIYPHARQVADFVFGQRQRRAFRDVVAVEYPRQGVYSLGFLTGRGLRQVKSELEQDLVTVFVPTSPTPLTGFVILLPADQVINLEMTVDEAFRYFITAGMLSSDEEGLEPDAVAELRGGPDRLSQ
ncbi:MAG: DUF502 domain-containing protein [Candidatus Brocadiaceae bacterium]|jgi:uncharacterized membrane protein